VRAIIQEDINEFKKEQTSKGNFEKRVKKVRKGRMAGNKTEDS